MTDELEQLKTNVSVLPATHFFAIQKRYEGWTYPRIIDEMKKRFDVDVAESTVRWWFYKGGPLATIYREYADKMTTIEIETARDFIKGNVLTSAKVLARVMAGGGSMAQVAAAREFLDRGLGKTEETVNTKLSGGVALGVVDILKLMKEAKQNDGTNSADNNQSAK